MTAWFRNFGPRLPGKQALTLWIMFVVFPLLMVDWGVTRLLVLWRTQEFQRWEMDAGRSISRILTAAGEEEMARRLFAGETLAASQTLQAFAGNEPAHPGDDPRLARVARVLASGQVPGDKEYVEMTNQLGWSLDVAQLLKTPGFPVNVRWGLSPAILLWDRTVSASGSSVRVEVTILPPLYSRLVLALDRHSRSGSVRGGIADRRARKWFCTPETSRERFRESLRRRKTGAVNALDQDTVFSRLELLEGGLVVYLESIPAGTGFSARLTLVHAGLLVLGLVLSGFFPWLRQGVSAFPVQMKLVALFILAVALPLLAALNLGLGIIGATEAEKKREILQEIRSQLMQFDGGYRREEADTAAYFRRVLRDPRVQNQRFAAVEEPLHRSLAAGMMNRFEIRDWEGRLLLRKTTGRPDVGLDMMLETLAWQIIGKVLPAAAKKRESSLKPEVYLTTGFVESPEFGFAEVGKRPDFLHFMSYGSSLFYLYWSRGGDPKIPAANAVYCFSRTQRQMVERYLRKNLLRKRPVKILARDRRSGKWLPGIPASADLELFSRGIARSGEDQAGRVSMGGTSFLAVGLNPLRLQNFDLIGLIREETVTNAGRLWKLLLGWGILLSLVSGAICAVFLADSVLVPLRNLTQGMTAIHQRDSAYRIPVRSGDELGKLSVAFNRMIEAAHELDMAKTVQESLMPSSPPTLEGYEVYLRNTMLVSIGGDYCDCFRLADGRLAMMIGDVAGHGIGAALLMSIAKAGVFFHFDEGRSEDTLFMRLNELLFELRKRGQFMSFCFGVLDPNRHELALTVAGHPLPIIVDPENRAPTRFDTANYPLGARKSQKFATTVVPLAPGATVLFYTDGIVEAMNAAGVPFGYDRLRTVTNGATPPGARSTVETCLAALDRHALGVPLNDDVTLLAVFRQPDPPSNQSGGAPS